MHSATTKGRATGGTFQRNGAHLALGVAASLATVALGYALWSVSDRLLYIGPLDRAAFGWAVVVPVWALAPVAAALAWRRLTPAAPRWLPLRSGSSSAVWLLRCCGRRWPSRIVCSEPLAARLNSCCPRASSGSSSASASPQPACFR